MVVCQKLFQCLQLLVMIILIVSLRTTLEHSTGMKDGIRCIEKEREALLKFKDELIDKYGGLATWGSEKDCCNWDRIRCDNLTNHIVKLDLRFASLRGNISVDSLLDIQHLRHLDLSWNVFYGNRIPQSIGSLRRLQYLNLSNSHFTGEIPDHLGNLSKLQFLDLSRSFFSSGGLLTSTNVDWLSRLHSLKYLNLLGVNLSMATNWVQTINKLVQLQHLVLYGCHIPMVLPSSHFMFNSSISLRTLDLSDNELDSSWIFPLLLNSNLSRYLSELYLDFNKLHGPIPDAIGNLFSLSHLSLHHNELEGKVPITLGNLSRLELLDLSNNHLTHIVPHLAFSSSLTVLDLGNNMFNGTITHILKRLSKLEALRLGSNYFKGIITESYFSNLSRLRELDLSSNPGISFNFSMGWNPPFQLRHVLLSGCKVGPHFPAWLKTQKELVVLDVSNAQISGTFPNWFRELSPTLQELNVSHNNFRGALPDWDPKFSSPTYSIDFSYNHFNGSLPIWPSTSPILVLSNNEFFGSITKLCNGTHLNWIYLDLSNNLLSGQIPDCFANQRVLLFLNLAHNNFSGEIPSLNSSLLLSLHLQNNSFTGEISTSLRNCKSLVFIDLSHNKLTGKIQAWVRDTMNELVFLSLKSNEFFGSIPSTLCHLQRLQVLDLSLNKITGGIPRCLNNFTAMSQVDNEFNPLAWNSITTNLNGAFLTWKGIDRGYKKNALQLMKLIDLSSNGLIGDVPTEISSLKTLVGLNLSRNNLSGAIPSKIGRLRSLDYLDLSRNHFTGDIPIGISQMDQLGVLDLSYNNLSGKIPQSNHMSTFNDSAFEGNNGLCGIPLKKTCRGDEIAHDPKTGDEKKSQEDEVDYGFYISIAVGFIFGFWGVCGTLVLNNSWRIFIFKLPNKVMDWCYVRIEISKIRLRETFKKFVKF